MQDHRGQAYRLVGRGERRSLILPESSLELKKPCYIFSTYNGVLLKISNKEVFLEFLFGLFDFCIYICKEINKQLAAAGSAVRHT